MPFNGFWYGAVPTGIALLICTKLKAHNTTVALQTFDACSEIFCRKY